MEHLEISHHFCCFKPKVAIQMLGSTPAHCTQHHGVLRCSCRWNARSIGWNHLSYGTSPLQQQVREPPEFPTNFTSYLVIYALSGTIFTDPWVSWSAKFGEFEASLLDSFWLTWAMKKRRGCLGYIGDYYTTQLYGDYFINQYKDPYFINVRSLVEYLYMFFPEPVFLVFFFRLTNPKKLFAPTFVLFFWNSA